MILLLNVKITDQRHAPYKFYHRYEGQHYPYSNRMDVFKYYLSSRSVLEPVISKYLFYIEISPEFEDRRKELEDYIKNLFPENKLVVYWHRNNYTSDWRNVVETELKNIHDDLIWLDCNDDHIFIDSTLDTVKNGMSLLEKDGDPNSFIYFSHWPEQIRLVNHFGGELVDSGDYILHDWNSYDAIMILKKERFSKYWTDYDLDQKLLYKPDELLNIIPWYTCKAYTPTKELVRHFDGYGHVGDISLTNMFPSLTIPNGFFENKIKIKYGYDYRTDTSVYLNPTSKNLYALDINGADYRWCLEDIPLFWKSRISDISIRDGTNISELKEFRNNWLLNSPKLKMGAYGTEMFGDNYPNRDHWFKKHLL